MMTATQRFLAAQMPKQAFVEPIVEGAQASVRTVAPFMDDFLMAIRAYKRQHNFGNPQAQEEKRADMDPAVGGVAGLTGAVGPALYGAYSGEPGRGARAAGRSLVEGTAGAIAGGLAGQTIGRATGINAAARLILNHSLLGLGAGLGSSHGAYKSLKNTSKKKDEKKEHKK